MKSNVVSLKAVRDERGVISYLEEFLEMARKGELEEVVITGRKTDGNIVMCCSGSPNAQQMSGILLDQAILRLGYQMR